MGGEVTNRTVTALRDHACEGDYGGPGHVIAAGQSYIRSVMFPGDVNSSDRPWVMRICVPCWRRYDADKPLPEGRKAKP